MINNINTDTVSTSSAQPGPNLQCQCYDRDSQSHRLQLINDHPHPLRQYAPSYQYPQTQRQPTLSTPPGLNSYCLGSCFTAERASVIVFVSSASSEYILAQSQVLPSVIVSTWPVITLLNHAASTNYNRHATPLNNSARKHGMLLLLLITAHNK